MFKDISILGSTGSIGVQTLDVCKFHGINVHGLAAGKNIDCIEKQILEFRPEVASVIDEKSAVELKKRLGNKVKTEVLYGDAGLEAVAQVSAADCVVSSIVGVDGFMPTMKAIEAGKQIALANKETLVAGGSIVTREAKKQGVQILPVDSEHSAIFQCMFGNTKEAVYKILLTASGGPFRKFSKDELENVTAAQALKHPNWVMGQKVTIDSATLMNKGLEVIEAKWLFDMDLEDIEVLIHPQSIIHSMVEFCDHSVIAQLGLPDMRLPIQVALSYPERVDSNFERLDFTKIADLTFEKPDVERFRCLQLAFDALKVGGTMPTVMNAANEVAVGKFLRGEIGFLDIARLVERAMNEQEVISNPSAEEVLEYDLRTRKGVEKWKL